METVTTWDSIIEWAKQLFLSTLLQQQQQQQQPQQHRPWTLHEFTTIYSACYTWCVQHKSQWSSMCASIRVLMDWFCKTMMLSSSSSSSSTDVVTMMELAQVCVQWCDLFFVYLVRNALPSKTTAGIMSQSFATYILWTPSVQSNCRLCVQSAMQSSLWVDVAAAAAAAPAVCIRLEQVIEWIYVSSQGQLDGLPLIFGQEGEWFLPSESVVAACDWSSLPPPLSPFAYALFFETRRKCYMDLADQVFMNRRVRCSGSGSGSGSGSINNNNHLYDNQFLSSVRTTVETALDVALQRNIPWVLEQTQRNIDGFASLLNSSSAVIIYSFYQRSPLLLRSWNDAFSDYIQHTVKQHRQRLPDAATATATAATAEECVNYLVAIADWHRILLSFSPTMAQTVHSAMESFVTDHAVTQWIHYTLDSIQKKGDDDAWIAHSMEKLFRHVIRYIPEKDVFVERYKDRMATRLLQQKSVSLDWERMAVGWIQSEMGLQLAVKLQGMLNDVGGGSGGGGGGVVVSGGMECKVFTQSHWPSHYRDLSMMHFPPVMLHKMQMAEASYFQQCVTNQRRRLKWMHTLGTISLIVTTNHCQTIELTLSTCQAVLLWTCFQEEEEEDENEKNKRKKPPQQHTFTEMKQMTNMPEDVLKKTLHSLTSMKYKLLTETAAPLSSASVWQWNRSFRSPLKKIRIPMANVEKDAASGDAAAAADAKIEMHRNHVLESCIVRIMKARKTLAHSVLVAETIQQTLLFVADAKMVKKRIESLIEREFIKRSDNDPSVYVYLA